MPGLPVTMPPSEREQVRELSRMLQLGKAALVSPDDERINLPESVYSLLRDAVRHLASGRNVTLVSRKHELTTQRAANMLGFSRPHLIKLLDAGVIPFQKVGLHRRVTLEDLLAFQKRRDAARKDALNSLARDEFESGSYEGTAIPSGGSDE